MGGLAAVGAGLGTYFYVQSDSHIEVRGSILKVRAHAPEERSVLAVIDFRMANPSIYQFWVQQVDTYVVTAEGHKIEGMQITEADTRKLFEWYPVLGQLFNDPLKMRERIPRKSQADRMIAARFEMPEEVFAKRKSLTVRIEEVDGQVSELTEERIP